MAVSRWERKIVALLHDPPDKPFAIRKHADRGRDLVEILLGTEPKTQSNVKTADQQMSAADRLVFPDGVSRFWSTHPPLLVHPTSGRQHRLPDTIMDFDPEITKSVIAQFSKGFTPEEQTLEKQQRLYLALWRCLPEALSQAFASTPGNLFELLPAETRQPDHPLPLHVALTAAAADALQGKPAIPALLHFSFSPVQSFIAAARKTQDLWMGSWLLSYLSWTAIQTIADVYGPDVILYPWLYKQPLCDDWLLREKQLGTLLNNNLCTLAPPRLDLRLDLPTLPNKFVALLPWGVQEGFQYQHVQKVAARAEQMFYQRWKDIAQAVKNFLKNEIPHLWDHYTEQIWDEQTGIGARSSTIPFSVFCTIFPWGFGDSADPNSVLQLYRNLCNPGDDWEFQKVYDVLKSRGKYKPKLGTVYSVVYELSDRFFRSRKTTRVFSQRAIRGSKCTMCGEREALRSEQARAREFWTQVARQNQLSTKFKPEGKERLCAVCTVKRLLPEILRSAKATELGLPQFSRTSYPSTSDIASREDSNPQPSDPTSYPSTSDIASAAFKQDLLHALKETDAQKAHHRAALQKALEALFNALEALKVRPTNDPHTIPRLGKLVQHLPKDLRPLGEQIVQLDGEIFYEERYTVESFQESTGESPSEAQLEAARQKLRTVLAIADRLGIRKPEKYYAIVLMDGDQMGKWISGAHDGLPRFRDILYPGLAEELLSKDSSDSQNQWTALLELKRIVTPSFHALISFALNNFALRLVPKIVEELYPARLVYAGGDDVLALVPLRYALEIARLLRAAFSGEIRFDGDNARALFGSPEATGYVELDGALLLTMGPPATASAGIAITHHLDPLDIALQAARLAERTAKHQYGRNALSLYLLKRSGEELRVGNAWFVSLNGATVDIVQQLNKIATALQTEKLSRSFPKSVAAEAEDLEQLPIEARISRTSYLLSHTGERPRSSSEEDQNGLSKKELEALLQQLVRIFASDNAARTDTADKTNGSSWQRFGMLAEWLNVLRFLTTEA